MDSPHNSQQDSGWFLFMGRTAQEIWPREKKDAKIMVILYKKKV